MELTDQQMDWKHSGLSRLVPTDDRSIQEIIMRSMYDSEYFAQTFMPETFSKPHNWQRKQHFALLSDDTIPYAYICAARGFFKTTVIQAELTRRACLRLSTFALVASKILDSASAITDNVRTQLLTNRNIREVFGNFKPMKIAGQEVDHIFNRYTWFLVDPKTKEPFFVCVPKGEGQQVNGLLRLIGGKSQRPDFLAGDDLEDRNTIYNEDQREKHRKWFEGAYLPCVSTDLPNPDTNRWDRPKDDPQWRPPWRVFHSDTLKHEASNMANIIQSGEWVGNVFPIAEAVPNTEDKYRSCMPDLWTHAQAQREYDKAKNKGALEQFATERLCIPQIPDGTQWSKSLFRYFRDRDYIFEEERNTFNFISVDPSRSLSGRSGFIGVTAIPHRKQILLRRHVNRRFKMEALPNAVFDMAVELGIPNIAVEITGGEDHTKYLFENVAKERGLDRWLQFRWTETRGVTPDGDWGTGREAAKRARASFLLPYYRRGEILHEESLRGCALEQQELSWPKCARWDSIDAASHIPPVLRAMGCYWETPIEPTPEIKSLKAYRDRKILDERLRSGSWRRAAL